MCPSRVANLDFNASLAGKVQIVNEALEQILAEQPEIQKDLQESLRYTLSGPGKRIRSALVLWCCELISGRANANARLAAAAIEMVHTYSLVHDDLPAMDDDDLRRGRPTCHKAFDEATAILTGDGLLTLAFEVLADQIDDPVLAVKLIGELARAAGPAGMIAGQVADLKAENTVGSVAHARIHSHEQDRQDVPLCGPDGRPVRRGGPGSRWKSSGSMVSKSGWGSRSPTISWTSAPRASSWARPPAKTSRPPSAPIRPS